MWESILYGIGFLVVCAIAVEVLLPLLLAVIALLFTALVFIVCAPFKFYFDYKAEKEKRNRKGILYP